MKTLAALLLIVINLLTASYIKLYVYDFVVTETETRNIAYSKNFSNFIWPAYAQLYSTDKVKAKEGFNTLFKSLSADIPSMLYIELQSTADRAFLFSNKGTNWEEKEISLKDKIIPELSKNGYFDRGIVDIQNIVTPFTRVNLKADFQEKRNVSIVETTIPLTFAGETKDKLVMIIGTNAPEIPFAIKILDFEIAAFTVLVVVIFATYLIRKRTISKRIENQFLAEIETLQANNQDQIKKLTNFYYNIIQQFSLGIKDFQENSKLLRVQILNTDIQVDTMIATLENCLKETNRIKEFLDNFMELHNFSQNVQDIEVINISELINTLLDNIINDPTNSSIKIHKTISASFSAKCNAEKFAKSFIWLTHQLVQYSTSKNISVRLTDFSPDNVQKYLTIICHTEIESLMQINQILSSLELKLFEKYIEYTKGYIEPQCRDNILEIHINIKLT